MSPTRGIVRLRAVAQVRVPCARTAMRSPPAVGTRPAPCERSATRIRADAAYEQAAFGLARAACAAQKSWLGKSRWGTHCCSRRRIEPMSDEALDPVEWELVRADIAMEKARLKANGDWSKWEEFQTQTNAMLAAYRERPLFGWRALRGRGLPMTEEERSALWWAVRTPELPRLMGPPRRPRRPGWPLR